MNGNGKVKSMKDVLLLLSEQMDQLRPTRKPTDANIQAARATSTVVNSYLGTIRMGMEYSKMAGQQCDLGFLQISGPTRNLKAA